MTTTMQSADAVGATELVDLLADAGRMAGAAGRTDLAERLAKTRARVANRTVRIVVIGARGQGTTSLLHVLRQTPADRLPGVTFLDAPAGPAGPLPPEPGSADAALFVAEAGHEYSPQELDMLARLRAAGLQVIGVLTKIDVFPRWSDVQRANRRRLQVSGLDSPSIPLLPVSAALGETGRQRGDEALTVSSGVPQLVDFLRDRTASVLDPALRDAALNEVRGVADQLTAMWNTELGKAHGPLSEQDIVERHQPAVAELDRLREASVAWQIALGDGATELSAQADHDLRGRLRTVVREAERNISGADPKKRWEELDSWLRAQVEQSVQANFQQVRTKTRQLSEQVGAKLAGPGGSVPPPDLRMTNPAEALSQVDPLEPPDSNDNVLSRVIGTVRGGYSGVLMIGVVTSIAGLQLLNVWSVSAGIALGLHTLWEEHRNGIERRKAEAKMAVSKLMDDVIFQVGDESRTGLRTVHRTLRDHFTKVGDEKLRNADAAVRAAAEAAAQHNSNNNGNGRAAQIQSTLAELRQLRQRATTP